MRQHAKRHVKENAAATRKLIAVPRTYDAAAAAPRRGRAAPAPVRATPADAKRRA